MNQENLNQKDTHLNEMLEIKNYSEFKSKVLKNIPNLKLMAKSFMQEHIKELTGQDVDPDHVRIYSGFQLAQPLATSYSGWQYWAPEKSLTLTNLAFKNFSAHDQDLTSDDLKLNYGVYKDGPKEKVMFTTPYHYMRAEQRMVEHFTEKDQVKILPSDLRKILNENDFYSLVKNSLNTFWEKHEADMLTLAKATFVSEARRARLEGVLSEDDYKLVMQTVVPHLPLEGPVTINQLASKTYSQGHIYSFDINGYSSNDILRFVKNDGHEILYIPGEKRPFEAFENDTAMRHWIVEQGKNSDKRSRLESHFSLYNRQDGTFHTGVDNGLLDLASGSWGIKEIDKDGNYFFASDALSTVIKQTKDRSFSDADIVIKSNAEITWEQWLGYTKIANQMFGPIIGLVGGAFGAVLATGTFAAQIGMEIHQAVTGDTEEERKEGFWAAGIDIGTTLLFAGFAKFIEVKNELSELSELASVNTEINIDNPAEKQVSGFIKGLNKSIPVVKVAEDGNGRDIWMIYDPLTEKVSGRRYYRAGDGSEILEPVPLSLSERLNKIRTEGLGGKRPTQVSPIVDDMFSELITFIEPDMYIDIPNSISKPDKQGIRVDSEGVNYLSFSDNNHVRLTPYHIPQLMYKVVGKDKILVIKYTDKGWIVIRNSSRGEYLTLRERMDYNPNEGLGDEGAKRDSRISRLKPFITSDMYVNASSSLQSYKLNWQGIKIDDKGVFYLEFADNIYIKLHVIDGFHSIYKVVGGDKELIIQYSREIWTVLNPPKGYPKQLRFFNIAEGESSFFLYSDQWNGDDFEITTSDCSTQTLTEHLSKTLDVTEAGDFIHPKYAELLHEGKITVSELFKKENLFSITKIKLWENYPPRSVYYPKIKYNEIKNEKIFFDSVPIEFDYKSKILATPDDLRDNENYFLYKKGALNLHVKQQGTTKSCGQTCLAMIALDYKIDKNISNDTINRLIERSDTATNGLFIDHLSENLSLEKIENNLVKREGIENFLQEKLSSSQNWTSIVNANGHFVVLTSCDTKSFYIRDPYQGILSKERFERLKQYNLGDEIIEIV